MKKILSFLLALVLISALVVSCTPGPDPTRPDQEAEVAPPADEPDVDDEEDDATPPPPGPAPGTFSEAPMLAERVAAGELPPVEERLPVEPVVVDASYFMPGTMDNLTIGTYGGELRVSRNEPNAVPDVFFMMMQPIIRLPNGLSDGEIQDNIVHFLGVSEDNTLFTFRLREGLRWSDGVPVTMEDIRFAYYDVTMNTEITPTVPSWLAMDGEAGQLEIIDELTFAFRFSRPHGSFVRQVMINEWIEYTRIIKPAHYLKQFHIDYADPDELRGLLEEEGLSELEWVRLFLDRDAQNRNINSRMALGMPVLTPWFMSAIEGETFIFERNPFYFKVDAAGNQLPYIDRIVSQRVQDGEMENMVMIAGEADLLRRNAALIQMPLYRQHEESGNFTTHMLNSHLDAPSTLKFNYSFGDENIRNMMLDHRFRQALALGIDMQEIIDTVYLGFGSIPERVPAHLDIEEANRLLDEMGMEIGANGWRNCPAGEPFTFLVESAGAAVDLVPTSEIVAAHMREHLNINAEMRLHDPTLFAQMMAENEIMSIIIWTFDLMADTEYTHRWLTVGPSAYSTNWMNAYITNQPTDAANMVEPPDWIRQGFEIHSRFMNAVYGSPEYFAIKAEAAQFYYENIPAIPLIEGSMLPIPISNRIANVPTGGFQICVLMATEVMFINE